MGIGLSFGHGQKQTVAVKQGVRHGLGLEERIPLTYGQLVKKVVSEVDRVRRKVTGENKDTFGLKRLLTHEFRLLARILDRYFEYQSGERLDLSKNCLAWPLAPIHQKLAEVLTQEGFEFDAGWGDQSTDLSDVLKSRGYHLSLMASRAKHPSDHLLLGVSIAAFEYDYETDLLEQPEFYIVHDLYPQAGGVGWQESLTVRGIMRHREPESPRRGALLLINKDQDGSIGDLLNITHNKGVMSREKGPAVSPRMVESQRQGSLIFTGNALRQGDPLVLSSLEHFDSLEGAPRTPVTIVPPDGHGILRTVGLLENARSNAMSRLDNRFRISEEGYKVEITPSLVVIPSSEGHAAIRSVPNIILVEDKRLDITWKPNTKDWFDAELGQRVPQIIANPAAVQGNAKTNEADVARLTQSYVQEVEMKWQEIPGIKWGRNLTSEEREEIRREVELRFRAVSAVCPSLLDWFGQTGISNYTAFNKNETTLPLLSTPLESALNHLHGLILLYARSGLYGWGRPGEGTLEFIGAGPQDYRIPGRQQLEGHTGFFFEIIPGTHESHAGEEYCLYYTGPLTDEKPTLLTTLGFIRRPKGWAVVRDEGGKGLDQKVPVGPMGGRKSLRNVLSKQLTGHSNGDIAHWFAGRLLRGFVEQEPGACFYWRPAHRQRWLLHQLPESTDYPQNSFFFELAGLLSRKELLEATDRAYDGLSEGERRQHPLLRVAPSELCSRFDARARALGFFGEEEEWYVLKPGDALYETLRTGTDLEV